MDAVKFIEERNRMCGTMSEVWGVDAAQIVKNTEEWSATHPRKTRQSEFLKLFPGVDVCETDGCLTLNPCSVYERMRKECAGKLCSECRMAFWLAEVENAETK